LSPNTIIKTAVAVLGSALLAFGSLATAAIYRQVIDPPIFFGVGLFDVDASCIPTTDGLAFLTPGVDCGAADIVDLLLQGNDPPTGTIRFAGPQPTNVISGAVTGLLWFDQALVGIDTTLLVGAGTGDFSNPGGYSLQYFAGPHVSPSNETFNPTAVLSCQSSDVILLADVVDPGQCLALAGDGGIAMQEPATLVPEPGTVGLLLGALSAVLFARRRARSI